MSSNESARSGKGEPPSSGRDREWKPSAPREPPANTPVNAAGLETSAGTSQPPPLPPPNASSLRSRIADQDAPRVVPQAFASSHVPDSSRPEEDRDGARKRTVTGTCIPPHLLMDHLTGLCLADRERGPAEASTPAAEQAPISKRLRINRDRYKSGPSHALAKKLLPIDPQAGDKGRTDRKD
jgi:THO complex subunit 2